MGSRSRLRLKFPRPSLLTSISLSLAAVGLIPLLLVSFRLVRVNQDALLDQVLATHSIAARTAATRVESFLRARASLITGLAGSPELSDPVSPQAQRLLAESLQSGVDFGVLALVVVNDEGEEVIRVQVSREGTPARVAEAATLSSGADAVAVFSERPPLLRLEAPLAGSAGFVRVIGSTEELASDPG